MTIKLSRRDFLKSTAALPSLLALPAWPSSAYQPKTDLAAVDFVWTCTDPFFEDDRDFYLGDGPSVFYDEAYQAEDLAGCLAKRTFTDVCGKTFLVRAFRSGLKAGLLSDQEDLTCPSLRSRNPLTTFHCPICKTGWWLGRAAKGFERTFFFSALDGASPIEHFQVSKAVLEPPADWTGVKEGQDSWLICSEPVLLPSEPRLVDYERVANEEDRRHRQAQLDWAACNAYLPNKARFTI